MEQLSDNQALVTFGDQLDRAVERAHDFALFPYNISKNWPELKGHESGLLLACGGAVIERLDLLDQYNLGREGIQIISDRQRILAQEDAETMIQHLAKNGDY